METHIQKWGNSLGVRIPKEIANRISLRDGSRVQVRETETGVMIEVVKKPKYHLCDLLQKITKANMHSEIEWGEPVGKEVW